MYTPLEAAKKMYRLQNGGKKKRGRKPVFSANQFYPWKAERMLVSLLSDYFREVCKLFRDAAIAGYTKDGLDELDSIDEHLVSIDIFRQRVTEFFDSLDGHQQTAMSSFFEKAVGIKNSVYTDVSDIRKDFVRHFEDVCKSATSELKTKIANEVYRYRTKPGEGVGLVKAINEINGKYTKDKARFIARNETGTLNAMIEQRVQTAAGFSMYEWMAMRDGVTRDTHRNLDGKICRWDRPDEYSDDGGKTWKKRTAGMFVGHPGEDYNCRCSAIPYDPEVDYDTEKYVEIENKPDEIDPMKEEAKTEEERREISKSQEIFDRSFDKFGKYYFDDIEKKFQEKDADTVSALKAMELYGKRNGSEAVNIPSRSVYLDGMLNLKVKDLTRILAHQKFIAEHPLVEDVDLVRGMYLKKDVLKKSLENGFLESPNITSWSVSKTHAKHFIENPAKKGYVKILVAWKARKGDFVAPIVKRAGKNDYLSNKEMEFDSLFGQKFKIIEAKNKKDVIFNIDVHPMD